MTSLAKSFCALSLLGRCMRRRGLGGLKSAAAMLSSMSGRGVSVTSSQLVQRAGCSETALVFHVSLRVSPLGSASSGSGRACVARIRDSKENATQSARSCQLPLSSRFCSLPTDSGPSSAGADSLQKSPVATGVLTRHGVADLSVGEGDERYENEYVAREAVLKYLKSEKIDTAELEAVALPPSVAVMAERIAFLMKIGLSIKDINEYPLMVGCSVKKNLIPVLNFLEKVNIEARSLPDVIRKYPMVLNSSVAMDLEPVIAFLLGIGIDRLNLGRVLTRYPDIFGFKIEGTMSTSVAYLVSLGVNMRDIGPMITEYPEILGMRVGNNLKLKVDYLLDLGIPKEVMAKVLEVKPFILGFGLEDKIKPAVMDLRALGLGNDSICRALIQYADVLGMDIRQRLDTKYGWLSKHAGVKRDDMAKILEKMPQILALNIALAQSRVTFLKDEGFSVEEIGIMVSKCPQILAVNVDEVLKPNLDFYRNSMKRPLSDIVKFPFYFTYNLEKRIRPRFIQIEQKGIQCSLPWLLNCSDSTFADRLLLDVVERPDEEIDETFDTLGGRVKIKGADQNYEGFDEESNAAAQI